MRKTWLIFENGTYYSVNCSLHRMPKDYPKPVDASLVTENEGDFTIAARKAVHAVFPHVKRVVKIGWSISAGFDLSERTGMDAGIAGQSGGLNFAVCFAKKTLRSDPGHGAATGIIEADGKIGRVKGIETKLKAVKDLVGENGIILFPEENLPDIPTRMMARFEKESIQYYPVGHLSQVMDLLFGIKEPEKKPAVLKNKKYY